MIYPDVARNAPAGDCVHRRAVPVYPALRESGRNVCMSAATELQSMLDRVPAFRPLSPEPREDLVRKSRLRRFAHKEKSLDSDAEGGGGCFGVGGVARVGRHY